MKDDGVDFQYTKNNHLTFGWAHHQNAVNQRVYLTKIGSCQRRPELGIREAIRAAQDIARNSDKIILCMSGGIDSECMALAFLAANVKFEVAICIYGPGKLNARDTYQAFLFCERHKIKLNVIEIDLVEFFESNVFAEIVSKSECRSPQLAVHLEIVNRIQKIHQATPVLSWNPCEVRFDSRVGAPVVLLPGEPYLAYLRYFMRTRTKGIPFFFAYSPELIYSFWQTQQFLIDLHLAAEKPRSFDSPTLHLAETADRQLRKIKKYQEAGFDVVARDAKMTGFEDVKFFFRGFFYAKGKISTAEDQEPFDTFYREPLVRKFPYPWPWAQMFSTEYFPRPDLLLKGS